MDSMTIESLLRGRGAWCKDQHGDDKQARANAELSRMIAIDYVRFENLREMLINLVHAKTPQEEQDIFAHPEMAPLLVAMEKAGLIHEGAGETIAMNRRGKRYLAGGWLEELAYLAAVEAGADEVVYSQLVGWEVHGFKGENEIDIVMRKGNKLSFVSCKALKSRLESDDRKHRNKLMEAVHEADNLADHFGRHGEKVAVVVTTDLYDQVRKAPRYEALMGKAEVLDVRLITLHELQWEKLVAAFANLMVDGVGLEKNSI